MRRQASWQKCTYIKLLLIFVREVPVPLLEQLLLVLDIAIKRVRIYRVSTGTTRKPTLASTLTSIYRCILLLRKMIRISAMVVHFIRVRTVYIYSLVLLNFNYKCCHVKRF